MPARVDASWCPSRGLSRNARSAGPARSSGATSLTRRSSGAPSRGEAPVSSAMSRNVRPDGRRKNSGSLMRPAGRARPALEFRPAAEAERLGAVVAFLGQGEGVIDPERAERRIPDQAYADGGARLERVGGSGAIARVPAVPAQRVRKNRGRKDLRAAVIPHTADVRERRDFQPDIFREIRDRGLQLEAGAPEIRATDVVTGGSRGQVARAESVRGKAADEPRSAEIRIEDAHSLSAPRRHIAGLGAAHDHDIGEHIVIVARLAAGLEKVDIAADTGKILLDLGQEAAGRIAVVVEGAVGQRIADLRYPERTAEQRLLDGTGDLAIVLARREIDGRGIGIQRIERRVRR